MEGMQSLLIRGLAALDIDFCDKIADRLLRYVEEIETWNPIYGLVNASGDDLIVKHILDSLAPWRIIQDLLEELDSRERCSSDCPEKATISDIGTGAGLPGIPLSIIMPTTAFNLIERMGKRINFLESQKAILSLGNVSVVESEAEKAKTVHDLVVFRAFRPFSESKLFKSIWKNLSPGGVLLAYKGKQVNTRVEIAEISADPILGEAFSKVEIRPIWVPFLEEERCVAIIRKPKV
jgi:16S rRNA (guanine527-N7)-methyltransferase